MRYRGYRRKRRRLHVGRLLLCVAVLGIVVGGGVAFGMNYERIFPKYDPSIMGAAYIDADMMIPTPTPKPTPTPGPNDVKAKFPGELVAAYNGKEGKTAFLTFDDGPTYLTPQILDILKEKGAVATFFTLGQNVAANPDMVRREIEEGHAVANHSYTHDYKFIYGNLDNFKSDIEKADKIIIDTIGEENYHKVFRFPGGSFEKSKDPYKQWLSDNGYKYIDWNCLNGDAEAQNVPADKLLAKVKNTSKGINNIVILMHDAATKKTTVEALPAILDYLKAEGYTFKTLNDLVTE